MKILQPIKPAAQQVQYPCNNEVATVMRQLSELPPLITALEIEKLKSQLADAAQGKRFLLQGGDCAESFADCNESNVSNKMRILLQMSLVLIHGLHKPIIRVGRMAGQYAKPRSSDIETQGDISLPSYRGDLINSAEFTTQARTPDPKRMLQAYQYSALTLNYIRA
jgi:3-deoxy-7-phosphoheptulonate synthase